MDVFVLPCHDVPVTCIVRQTEKISKEQPVFKDKSEDSKKVAIVRRTLSEHNNFPQILAYILL